MARGSMNIDVRLIPEFTALGGRICSQCGGSWGDAACGPTHALIKWQRLNLPVFTFTDDGGGTDD